MKVVVVLDPSWVLATKCEPTIVIDRPFKMEFLGPNNLLFYSDEKAHYIRTNIIKEVLFE